MTASRGFPKNPLRDRPDPFRDAEGKNPFSEGQHSEENVAPVISDNVYAASASATGEKTLPVAYEAWQPSRGGTLLIYVIAGWGLAAFSWAMCGPGMVAALALTVTTMVMAQGDLSAMKAGAMVRKRRGMTIAAYWLSLLGSLAIAAVGVLTAYQWYQLIADAF